MIELIKQQYASDMSNEDKINRVREFLQILTLKFIYDKGHFFNIAFVGGTALRILYNLRRFSEDLDFSLINKDKYNFSKLIGEVKKSFEIFNIDIEIKVNENKTVHSAFLKFPNLLSDLKLSPFAKQKISVRIEVDTTPPKGFILDTTFINKLYIFTVTHFDLSSLYATKLHACFFRKFTKGRDYYDLLWYLSKDIKPNYMLLNNAIKQTENLNLKLSDSNFKNFMLEKIRSIDYEVIKKDVDRFLEDKNELSLLNLKTFENIILKI